MRAVDRTESTGSARLAIEGVSEVAARRTAISCDGVADYVRRRSRISCRFGDALQLESITVGGVSYTRLRGSGLGQLGGGKWQVGSGSDTSLQDLSPSRLLALIRRSSLAKRRIGSEGVRGTATDHYRLTVDRKKARLQTPGGKTADVDVWVDRDGLLRRVSVEDGGRFTLEFFAFGTPVEIERPPTSVLEKPEPHVRAAPLPPCGGVVATPVTPALALAALRRNGFSVGKNDQSCGRAPVAMILSNLSSGTAALDREGALTCVLLSKSGDTSTVVLGATGADARLRLANLDCSLRVVGNDPRAAPRVARLERAFAELRRALRR